jgi:WD40 repeat protein
MTIGYDSVPVTTAMFSNDGKRILSSHEDGSLRFWDVTSGRQVAKLKIGELSFAKASPDGKTILAVAGEDGELQVKILDASNGRALTKFDKEDTSYLEALAISPDGSRFATSDVAGDVLLWDVAGHKPIHALEIGFSGNDAIAFSPDGKTLAIGGRNQNLFLFDVASGKAVWQLIPSYQASETEIRLTREKDQRRAVLDETEAQRDKQAAIDTETYKKQVNITFHHYGYMSDPGEQRMMVSGEPKNSKEQKSPIESNAVWLRLRNDSPLPISVPTQSMYLPNPKCFFEFSPGNKILGLCDEREIAVWFGVENQKGIPIPYGFDFGSNAILLPKMSALFAVPRAVFEKGNVIRFDFTFKKDDGANKIADYGTPKPLKFRGSDLPLIY